MTAIRDRQSDPDTDDAAVPWDERPVVGARRGLPWWGAVLLALGLALVGAIVDLQLGDGLGLLFKGCYFVGAVGAICAVRRRGLFGPMVQPPLILALTVPTVVLLGSELPSGSDTLAKALAVSTPLINGFPTMAITTGVTLLIGIVRLYREREPQESDARGPSRTGASRTGTGARKGVPSAKDPSRKDAGSRQDAAQLAAKDSPAARAATRPPRESGDAAPPRRRGPADGRTGERRPPGAEGRAPGRGRPGPRDDQDRGPRAAGRAAAGEPPRRPRPPNEGGRRRDGLPPDRDRNPKPPRRRPPPEDPRAAGGPDSPRRPPERRGYPPRRRPRERPWDDDRD